MSTTYDPWDDEGKEPKPERAPNSRPKDGESTYTWKGKEYPRVTDILGIAPGQHLMAWYGKVAALRAAAPLIHSGLYTPDCDDTTMAELERFVDAEAIRVLDTDEAIRQACNWAFNMREAERYRDHRARIGSLVHHGLYAHALGLRVSEADRIDYLQSKARELRLVPESVALRYAELGKDLSSIETDLAHHALPHLQCGLDWIETFKPEWQAIGLEAIVVNTEEEYAGTEDWEGVVRQCHWEKAGLHWPFGGPAATVGADWKTGKESRSHRLQAAAYARAEFIGLVANGEEHPVTKKDGLMVVYTSDSAPAKAKTFVGEDTIDELFDAFCDLNGYYRHMNELPRAVRSRKFVAKKLKKGERTCPI